MSRSFVEPDWTSFDSKADWRDSLQHFNLHGDYIGGDGGWVLPKWCIAELKKRLSRYGNGHWTAPPIRRTPGHTNGRPESLHQLCRLQFLKLLALGYCLSAQVCQRRPQIFVGVNRCIPDADLVVQVRAGGASTVTNVADHLPANHRLAFDARKA